MAQFNFKNITPTFIKNAGAEFAKYYLDGDTATKQSLNLKLFVANTILPLITEAVLMDLVNRSGDLTNAGAEFQLNTYPRSQAKTDPFAWYRFKTIQIFITRGTWDTTRTFSYINQNRKDWDLAGLSEIFSTYIGRIMEAMRAEVDEELTFFLTSNVLSDQIYVNDVPTVLADSDAFLNGKVPKPLLDLKNAIIRVGQIGLSQETIGRAISLIVKGMDRNNYKIVASPSMVMLMKNTFSFRTFGSQQETYIKAGLDSVGQWEGLEVIESKFFEARKVDWVLLPIGDKSPISMGFAYIESATDKVMGSATALVHETEYRYGMFVIKPLDELVFMSVRPEFQTAKGKLNIGQVGSTKVQFSGNITSATDTIASAEIKVTLFDNTVVSTVNPTIEANGNFTITATLTGTGSPATAADKAYVATLSVFLTSAPATAVLVDKVVFETTIDGATNGGWVEDGTNPTKSRIIQDETVPKTETNKFTSEKSKENSKTENEKK